MDYRHYICLITAVVCFGCSVFLIYKNEPLFSLVALYFGSEFVWHAVGWASHTHP